MGAQNNAPTRYSLGTDGGKEVRRGGGEAAMDKLRYKSGVRDGTGRGQEEVRGREIERAADRGASPGRADG